MLYIYGIVAAAPKIWSLCFIPIYVISNKTHRHMCEREFCCVCAVCVCVCPFFSSVSSFSLAIFDRESRSHQSATSYIYTDTQSQYLCITICMYGIYESYVSSHNYGFLINAAECVGFRKRYPP